MFVTERNNMVYNPYTYLQQNQQLQTIQPVHQRIQPQVMCYFAQNVAEMDNIKLLPDTYYIGINQNTKEIYIRKMNNMCLAETEIYNLVTNKKEKSELETILERLNNLESKITKGVADVPNNTPNVTTGDANVNVGQA